MLGKYMNISTEGLFEVAKNVVPCFVWNLVKFLFALRDEGN